MSITLSVIKADIWGYVGHSESHRDLLAKVDDRLTKAKRASFGLVRGLAY